VDADLPRFCWGKRVLGWAAQEANNLTMAHVFMLMTSHRMTYHDIVAKGHRSTSRNRFFSTRRWYFQGLSNSQSRFPSWQAADGLSLLWLIKWSIWLWL
jgi:hypothetical protein